MKTLPSEDLSNCQLESAVINDNLCSLKFEWFNSKEAADFLRLSVKALRNLTSRGEVPFYKLGRRNRYRRDELETLLLREKRG